MKVYKMIGMLLCLSLFAHGMLQDATDETSFEVNPTHSLQTRLDDDDIPPPLYPVQQLAGSTYLSANQFEALLVFMGTPTLGPSLVQKARELFGSQTNQATQFHLDRLSHANIPRFNETTTIKVLEVYMHWYNEEGCLILQNSAEDPLKPGTFKIDQRDGHRAPELLNFHLRTYRAPSPDPAQESTNDCVLRMAALNLDIPSDLNPFY